MSSLSQENFVLGFSEDWVEPCVGLCYHMKLLELKQKEQEERLAEEKRKRKLQRQRKGGKQGKKARRRENPEEKSWEGEKVIDTNLRDDQVWHCYMDFSW
jgi:hypothetical protein